MAVARKPKATKAETREAADERAIEALINKGGSVAEAAAPVKGKETNAKTVNVVLRMPPQMAQRVDEAVDQRALKTPRHTWLLEAVLEKLEREQSE